MFKYDGNNEKIIEAVKAANDGDLAIHVVDAIKESLQFDMTIADNDYIADAIRSFLPNNDIYINVYYPKWRYSKAIGYFAPSNPTTININGYKLNRSIASFVGNFWHELVHMISNQDREFDFDHGSNNPSGKENTAPYAIGRIASEYIDYSADEMSSGQIEYYIPWYKKLINKFMRLF